MGQVKEVTHQIKKVEGNEYTGSLQIFAQWENIDVSFPHLCVSLGSRVLIPFHSKYTEFNLSIVFQYNGGREGREKRSKHHETLQKTLEQ